MKSLLTEDLLVDLRDLLKQAQTGTDRITSAADVLRRAIAEIERLSELAWRYEELCR